MNLNNIEKQQKLNFENEIRCFSVCRSDDDLAPFIAVIEWNSQICRMYRGVKFLFEFEINDLFEQSI